MKYDQFAILLCALLFCQYAFGQWTTLPSGTSSDLLSIDFLNENNGVAGGRNGTILLTADGGNSWTPLDLGSIDADFRSVLMLSADTILAAGGNIFEGQLYRTVNGGQLWTPMTDYSELQRSSLGVLGLNYESINYSGDRGTTWTPTGPDLGGTLLLQSFHFADSSTGHLVGNVGGFATYSAFGLRTEDGGLNWSPWFVFDFPNSNAATTYSAPDADTAYLFSNALVNFMPGPVNQLIRMTDFQFDASPSINSWRFNAETVNDNMPGFLIASHFLTPARGYAGGMAGDIYVTENGGQDWTLSYDGDTTIFEIIAVDGQVLYAVGGNGLILRLALSSSTRDHVQVLDLDVYPNPAREQLFVRDFPAPAAAGSVRSLDGKLIRNFRWAQGESIPVQDLTKGVYLLEFRSGRSLYRSTFTRM